MPPCTAPSRGDATAPRFEPGHRGRDNTRPFPRAAAMTILRMTDLDLAGKRVLIRQGEAA